MKSKRIHYLDLLRVLAIICVIIIHMSSQSPFYAKNLHTISWLGVNFWDAMVRFSVPIFVMISGVLFLDPQRRINMHRVYKKNIVRIITAFIFWDLFYAFYTYFFETHTVKMLLTLIFRGYSHLWFLPMIVGLYLIVPFLRKFTTDQNLMKYYLALAFFFSILLPTFYTTYYALAAHHSMPFMVQLFIYNFQKVTDSIYFRFTMFFSTYFVAGYYFHQVQLSKRKRYIIYILGLIGLIGGWAFSNFFSLRYNTPITPLYDYMSLPVALTSIAVFVLIKEIGEKIKWNNHSHFDTFLTLLSKLTFGIYLVHFVFIRILVVHLNLFTYLPNTFIAVPIGTIIVFILSAAVMYLVSYIPWFNRHTM